MILPQIPEGLLAFHIMMPDGKMSVGSMIPNGFNLKSSVALANPNSFILYHAKMLF